MRARAASTSAATRREVEQSIARFEKQLDGASDALQALGKHLGRSAQGGYKEVTTALRSLRRDAGKANKQALKDFDKLRQTLSSATASTTSRASRTNSGTKRSGSRSTGRSTTSRSTGSRKAASRASSSTAKRSTAARSTAKRSTAKRSTAASRAKKSS